MLFPVTEPGTDRGVSIDRTTHPFKIGCLFVCFSGLLSTDFGSDSPESASLTNEGHLQ